MRGIVAALTATCLVTFPGPTAADEHFENRIRPILVEHCLSCHSAKAGKAKGGLALDTRDSLRKGGDGGPLLDFTNPGQSLLLKVLKYDGDIHMPPKGKLPDAVIVDFAKWIAAGAPDPRGHEAVKTASGSDWAATFNQRRKHWSWQPLKVVSPPTVREAEWQANPIDRFIRAKQATLGIEPAAEADRATLLRRVTYLLTGLPPSAAEIEAFLKDTSPNAYEKVVDRLLASPRFGERIATHWLDVMRYAESHGSEGDPSVPFAWRYRDYVIRAFNADLPYDRFVREQIAGDLLPDPRINTAEGLNESMIGPAHFRMVEHGFQPVDSLDEQVKTVDNQIDVISKAFLGLTVSCARCHDHKFDAISQRDFYALYGILASSRPGQVTIDNPAHFQKARAKLETAKARVKSELATLWLAEAEAIARKLSEGKPSTIAMNPEKPAESQQREARLAEIDRQALAAVRKEPGVRSPSAGPRPFAAWRFDSDAHDAIGELHGELLDGATIRDGKLVLSGKGAHVRTAPLKKPLREKTLEAWVSLARLDQKGSGVLSVESRGGAVFDAIVIGEKQSGHWIAGSNNFRRTQSVEGIAETATGTPIHLAITYASSGEIRLFRNGEPYGKAYKPAESDSGPIAFEGSDARILIGLRHGTKGALAGEVDEARLYDRALTAEEVKRSYQAGANLVSEAALLAVLTPELLAERAALKASLAKGSTTVEPAGDPWTLALREAAKDLNHPLHPWALTADLTGAKLTAAWDHIAEKTKRVTEERREFNRTHFTPLWNAADPANYAKWSRHGPAFMPQPSPAGDFALEGSGTNVVTAILPAGAYSHTLSSKLNGILTSPRFKLPGKFVSVRMLGDHGGSMRIIPNNYPLGNNGTYPQKRPEGGRMGWSRFDVSYRSGADAYFEFAKAEDLTNTRVYKGGPAVKYGRAYIGVAQIVFHNDEVTPRDDVFASLPLFAGNTPTTREELAALYGSTLQKAILAWRDHAMTDEQAAFLDEFVRSGLLTNVVSQLPASLTKVVEAYRKAESSLTPVRRAPGLLEAEGHDAPLFVRGNHRSPAANVPRGFLEALGGKPYATSGTGRLELANDLTSPANPLTPRVMVNRLWQWMFGRGLVATPDNFGKLGETPTHPELLDFLADRFTHDGWSVKRMLRLMATSRTFRESSIATTSALEKDPANHWLSRARVRRLEAEAIRDGLLTAAGELNPEMYGPGFREGALDGGRRSVYLAVKRNSPHLMLEVFDKPAPLSCRGQRDVTTLPAQSLTLLNSPFTADLAKRWGTRLAKRTETPTERIRGLWRATLGREPTPEELARIQTSLDEAALDAKTTLADPRPWQDLVQSVICLKEAIYLR